jgi:hypothetical protein
LVSNYSEQAKRVEDAVADDLPTDDEVLAQQRVEHPGQAQTSPRHQPSPMKSDRRSKPVANRPEGQTVGSMLRAQTQSDDVQ